MSRIEGDRKGRPYRADEKYFSSRISFVRALNRDHTYRADDQRDGGIPTGQTLRVSKTRRVS